MKQTTKLLLVCLGIFAYLHLTISAFAQAPQAFPYQAVARDINGNLLANQNIALRFSILDGSNVGAVLYQEKHLTTTNALGLFNLNIGQGTVLSGTFSSINWGSGSKFIKVELDPSGGNIFTVMGTTQLLSVPYALYANVPGVAGPQGLAGANGKTILNGTVNPTSGQGVDGDFFLNTTSKQIFGPKTAGAWGSGTSLVGPQGLQGIQGAQGIQGTAGTNGTNGANGTNGTNGKTILNGTVNPTSGQGIDGDFFLNTTSKQIFGPKTAGAWGSGTSLIGPQGPQGIQGPAGAGGMANGTATGNTTFWNGTTWVVNNSNLYNNGGSIGMGTNVPSTSAKLDISSTNQGLLIPRMTSVQRDAIPTPAIGLQIFNLDDQCIDMYDGTNWIKTCGMKVTGTVNDPYHIFPNSWAPKANFSGSNRNSAIAFSIGNKAYIGLGTFMNMLYYNDFYEYDPSTNVWTQKANFPGVARADAVAFSIGNKGYISTGSNGMFSNYDMWEYDPALDTWTQKSNCPGSARFKAQGFSIGTKGYLGLGTDGSSDLNDFWEYNPTNDTWTQKANYPGSGRRYTMGLSVNGKGYIGLGTDINGNYYNDVWEFNPSTNAWTAKAAFPGGGFHSMACFTMNSKGYMGTGYNGANDMTDFWEYNASADVWTSKALFTGAARKNAIGFAVGNKGYIATGFASINSSPLNDTWEYMDGLTVGNSYSSSTIASNNTVSDGAWTLYNNQVYNSNSGNVGIGTSYPTNKLSVSGNVDVSGNLGIGTATPVNKLSIVGNTNIIGNLGIGTTNPTSPLTLNGNMNITGEIKNNGVSGLAGQILQSNGNGSMSWINNSVNGWVSSGNDIKNSNTGNVGIGSFPSAGIKFDVSGNGRFAGSAITGINDKGCLATETSTGLFTTFINQIAMDGQRIQASGGQLVIPYNPIAQNLYLNSLGGNVGIRTTSANASLSVARGTGTDGTAAFFGTTHVSHFNYGTNENTYIRAGKNGSKVFINDGTIGAVVIGDVSSFPAGYKLYVDDGILTERLKVAVNGSGNWADYVFADDYKLMPLDEVEAFVKQHNHLPNVPSADQMVESGIDVATVDAKLMEKIEELTLYMIEMKREMKKLSDENASIKSQLKNK